MRTRTSLSVICLSSALAFGGLAHAARPTSYKALKYPPIHDIKVPEATRFELPNGMVVFLIEDHELPKANIHVTVRAGSRWEPADKAGLAEIMGTVMRTGGSVTRSGDQLDEELDRLGASIETGLHQDSGGAFASLLKEDLDRGIDIVADIIQHPAFPQDKLDLAKIEQRDAIARRNDNPNGIAFREFGKLLYGKDSPYARQTEYATIEAITRDDLVAFHRRLFQPENAILGVTGDFDSAHLRAKIEQAFGSWPRGGQPKAPVPQVDLAARARAGFYSATKSDMQQSWVVMGALGGKRNDPDLYALQVMNEVLGGGYGARLFSNVRSEQGLAYAVGSRWNAEWDHPGTLFIGGSSKPQTTVKLYQSMLKEVERMAQGGVTADELARAKDSILKGFAFEFDNTNKVISRLMNYEFYAYPPDYLQQYHARINKVTQEDVARVAKQYLKPGEFAVLFVGNGNYESPLTSLGPVQTIDITIPEPQQKQLAAATPESIAKGKRLLSAVLAATGGKAVLAVKDESIVGQAAIETPQGPMSIKMEASINLAGKLLQRMQTPMGQMTTGFDGQTAWMSAGGQTQELPGSQKGEFEASLRRETVALLQHFDEPGLTIQSLGTTDFDGKQVEAIAISDPASGFRTKVFIDPTTHMIVAKQFMASIMGPPAETEEVYSDYRDVAGVKMPFKSVTRQAGKTRVQLTASEVKINPGVPESTYKKP